jgi:micrococcal nuclease
MCFSPVPVRQAFLAIAAAFVFLFVGLADSATPGTRVAKVKRVSDGNTLTALTAEGTQVRLRLLGIDAPEVSHGKNPGQPFGEEAREYLARLIGGRTVRVESYGQDGSDRTLAIVFLRTVNVNVEMVQLGLAKVDRGAPCKVYCRDLRVAERRARRDQVGMWAQASR